MNTTSTTTGARTATGPLLVISAHAGDFVWRAGGAIALTPADA